MIEIRMDAMATISGRDNPLVAEDPIWVLAGNTNPQDVGFQQSEPVFIVSILSFRWVIE